MVAVSAHITRGVREFLEAKCAESGGTYQPESIDALAAEMGLSKSELLEARSNLLSVNELYVTRGRNTKYSLSPFPPSVHRTGTKANCSVDMDSLSALKESLDRVDFGQVVNEYKRLKALEDSFGEPSVVRRGNTIVKTYTVVEQG